MVSVSQGIEEIGGKVEIVLEFLNWLWPRVLIGFAILVCLYCLARSMAGVGGSDGPPY